MKKWRLFYLLIVALTLSACQKKAQIPFNKTQQEDTLSQEILKLNLLIAEVEEKEIRHYADTAKHHFQMSSDGFWYAIGKTKTDGERIADGDLINIRYQVEALSGEVYYAASEKTLAVGKERNERGFQNALQLLRDGDQAEVIVPSNLAFGVLGDRNKIPPRAVLVYRIYSVQKIRK